MASAPVVRSATVSWSVARAIMGAVSRRAAGWVAKYGHLRVRRIASSPGDGFESVSAYSRWLAANAQQVGVKVAPFTARDLRRTCETRLAELGVSKEDRAQLLSHGISGVQAKHYDRHSYLPQKRAALEKWADYLDGSHGAGRWFHCGGARPDDYLRPSGISP